MERESIQSLLSQACRQSQPVQLISVGSGAIHQGRLSGLFEGFLSFEVLSNVSDFEFKPLSECVVVFHRNNRGHVFLSSVRDFSLREALGLDPLLVVKLPSEIATESRAVFRVPIYADSGLRLQVHLQDGTTCTPEARDISLGGLLLEFERQLEIGALLQVHLEKETYRISLQGVVRWRDGSRHGIFFPEVLTDAGQIDAPSSLRAIVHDLERVWLRKRVSLG